MSAIVGGSFKVASTVANQFDTQLAATLVNPFPGYESLQTFGYNTLGDGGAGNYKHVLSTARQLTKFTSPDGRIWELMDREIDLRQTGLKWDDPSFDNGPMLNMLFAEASAAGRKLVARIPGTLYVGNVDVTCLGHLVVDFMPGVWFHGMPGFELGVIILRGRISGGARIDDICLKNFWVDSSERIFGTTGGTGLAINNWNLVYTENFKAFAGTDPRGVGTPPVQHGDSGMTTNSVNNSLHVNMWCRGHPDLGLYITADPPLPPAPATPVHPGDANFMDRGGHTIINPRFIDCTNGMKASRGSRRLRVIGGDFIRCSTGILMPDLSGTTPPPTGVGSDNYPYAYEMTLIGLNMKRVNCGIRLGPLQRASVIGCQVEDWGYQPIDGTIDSSTSGSVRAAYALHGATNVHFAGCRGWFRDWDSVDEGPGDTLLYGFRLNSYTSDTDGTVYQSENNVFTDCIMEGGNRAYQEEDLSDNNRGTIYCIGVGTTMGSHPIYIRPGSSSQIRNGAQPINSTEIHSGNANYSIIRDDAPNHRFIGALSTNRTVDFVDLDQQLQFQIFHISNETTSTTPPLAWDIIVAGLGVGGLTSLILKRYEWVDLMWDGTTLEVTRAGSIYPTNIGRGQSGATALSTADELVIENDGDAGLSILTPAAFISRICMGDSAVPNRFVLSGDPTGNVVRLGSGSAVSPNHLVIQADGDVMPSVTSAQTLGDATHHWLQTYTDELSIGGGTNVKRVLTATATLDFPSISASGGAQNLTVTVTGAVVNDSVSLGPPSNGGNVGLVYKAWVSVANTVTIQAINPTASLIDPASATFRVTVIGY